MYFKKLSLGVYVVKSKPARKMCTFHFYEQIVKKKTTKNNKQIVKKKKMLITFSRVIKWYPRANTLRYRVVVTVERDFEKKKNTYTHMLMYKKEMIPCKSNIYIETVNKSGVESRIKK